MSGRVEMTDEAAEDFVVKMTEEDTKELSEEQLQRILDFVSGAMSVVRVHQFGAEGVIFAGMLKAELDIGFEQFESHYTEVTEWMNATIPVSTNPDDMHDQVHKYMRVGTEEINKHIHKADEKKFQVPKGYA